MLGIRSDWYLTVRHKDNFLLNPQSMSVWLDGKEMKSILQETARETTTLMKLTANDVGEIKSSSSRNPNPLFANTEFPTGNQWRQELRKWFSSPDPSTNQIILCRSQHQGTAEWSFRGSFFEEWKSTGSLLWIYGKRMSSDLTSFHFLIRLVSKAGSGKSVLWCAAYHMYVLFSNN